MSFFSKPKIPATPQPPSTASAQIQQTQLESRRRALLARGRQSQILTQPIGLGTVGQQAA
jgi:hypothetical protein